MIKFNNHEFLQALWFIEKCSRVKYKMNSENMKIANPSPKRDKQSVVLDFQRN